MGGRVSVVEYEPYADFVAHAAAACAATPDEVRRAVRVQGDRLRRVLNLGASPIWLNGNELVAEDIAGLVRLLPGLEVEIAPKFLGTGWEHWREDFLVVANIARSGQLLIREGIASSTGVRDDLASLIARTFTDLFERNRRLPLRTYRRQRVEEWSLDGDVDPEEVVLPGTDGYRIERTVLTNQNRHNAVIAHAARVLAPEVHDGVLQRQVHRIAQRLSPQRPPPNRPRVSVPTRHRRWQQCYDLAREINAGFGVRLAPDRYSSPGYVLSTPSAFEHLLVTALRVALPGAQVTYHPSFRLGARQDGSEVSVTPDVIVRQAGGGLSLLDA